MRTIIDLPEEQVKALASWCEEHEISRAEAIRRALGSMLSNQHRAGREKAFGAWKGKNIDSRNLVKELREEWDS
ncbi:MAG: ribbon-helix-helix protein, CopG family [Verrucomicrobiota bacterium]